VLNTGLITFGGGYNDLGFDRFVHMQTAGPAMVNKIPVIAAFYKLRMNGSRYVNELSDRMVITWDVSEPTSGQQDMTFTGTPHHFQVVLHRDGHIDLSYRQMTARDGVVGVYSVPAAGAAAKSTDLSSVKPTDAPRPAIFESFHHDGLPGSESMACSVIQALGDRFDFMVWYSDFRVDDQEAGTRSVGEIGQRVSGIGPRMDQGMHLQDYCSQGRLQVTWFQPVWIGAVQAQERHPNGNFPGATPASRRIDHGRRKLEGQRRQYIYPPRWRDDESCIRILISRALPHGLAPGVRGAGLSCPAQSTRRRQDAGRQQHLPR
jgi:hypothetical protein